MSSHTISSRAHQWGHLAVILFHIIMACAWIFCNWYLEEHPHSSLHQGIYITSYVLAGILLLISILGIVPIIKKWNSHMVITPDPLSKRPPSPELDSDSEPDEHEDE